MKLLFRVSYHTHPGESLWLVMALHDPSSGLTLRETTAMHWRDPEHWETEIEIDAANPLEIHYHYQLRDARNGATLDEAPVPRRATLDPASRDAHALLDDWRSPGTLDRVFETTAFGGLVPARSAIGSLPPAANATHTITLHMAAVPDGLVPCIAGGIRELGDWDWNRAIPLVETSANHWQASLHIPADWHVPFKFGLHNPSTQTTVELETGDNRTLAPHARAGNQLTEVACEAYRRHPGNLPRAAGVAIPVFALRSGDSLGIGEFADLKPFADWAADTGFKLIQILPVNDTTSAHDWTDSYPYSAISVFALHPAYLRIEDLHLAPASPATLEETRAARENLNPLAQIDHEQVMAAKSAITRKHFDANATTITTHPQYLAFLAENHDWVVPYAAFCVLRDEYGTAEFSKWRKHAVCNLHDILTWAMPDNPRAADTAYHIWLQYELDHQLADAVAHLHSRGLALKGDLPIGIDRQSVDAWSAPHLFNMNAQAGAPPDAFAVKGQNWGFPTYNWDVMRADDYQWWRARFQKLSRYFDAYRIDHILGFFRIWQVPVDHVEGIMGFFDPAMPVHIDEIRARGIDFDPLRHCRPFIRDEHLDERFGIDAGEARYHFLDDCGHGFWKLRDHVATQRLIVRHFDTWDLADPITRDRANRLRQGLLDCAAEVLFLEVPGSNATLFHPRCALQSTRSYQSLDATQRARIDELYTDYFYHRQEAFWEARGLEKLPAMRAASPMLLCGEDLGMVPACVPGVLERLGILSLEIQRMPKSDKIEFFHPADAPYLSVVSPSTHDMPTLRAWWREDANTTARFAWNLLGRAFPPAELDGEMAAAILDQHLHSPAMWAIFPLQDLLAIDESIRHPDPDAERINIPAIMPYYWRYRCHLATSDLTAASAFNNRIREAITQAGRLSGTPVRQ